MLRVLQDRTFEVLGSSQQRTVDVRVVSATNRNLAEMVARGEFREDLLYRINLIAVHLPPLRERRDDIPLLAGRFLQTVGAGLSARRPATERRRDRVAAGTAVARQHPAAAAVGRAHAARHGAQRPRRRRFSRGPADMEPRDAARDTLPAVGSMTLDEIEKAMILKSLKHHGGNISKVAEALGLSRAALYRRFEKYEIHV